MLEESDHAYERSGDAERRYLVQDAERPDGMQRRRRVSHLDRTALYEHECSTQSGETYSDLIGAIGAGLPARLPEEHPVTPSTRRANRSRSVLLVIDSYAIR